jgi:hypothetical protein
MKHSLRLNVAIRILVLLGLLLWIYKAGLCICSFHVWMRVRCLDLLVEKNLLVGASSSMQAGEQGTC